MKLVPNLIEYLDIQECQDQTDSHFNRCTYNKWILVRHVDYLRGIIIDHSSIYPLMIILQIKHQLLVVRIVM